MEPIALILGIGISAFLLLYFIFNMQKEYKDSPWHVALRLLIIFFFIIHLILLAKAIIDNTDNCEFVNVNTTRTYIDAQNFTDANNYDYVCVTDSRTTTTLFYRTILWLWRLLAVFIGMYFVYELFSYMGQMRRK